MIETWAPGKLFIVGEYAVVTAGEPAVLVALDRYLRVRLTELEAPNITQHWSTHVAAAVQAVHELCATRAINQRNFEIETESELEDSTGRKFGLGSSAAATVATVEALDRLYGLQLSPLERMKLALLATIEVSPRASGGDIAASTFGGWIFYRSPDRTALRAHRAKHGIESALASDGWNSLEVRHLRAPDDLRMLVGWTGSPASTEQLVDTVTPESNATRQVELFEQFLTGSRQSVEAFALELETFSSKAREQVRQARRLLQALSNIEGISIETPLLRTLCETAEQHGAVAKPSGAGGGDCGIAFSTASNDSTRILQEWEKHGIQPLHLNVHRPIFSPEGGPDAY